MRDTTTDIEVHIKPYGSGQPYPEWQARMSSIELRTEGRNECYIEAVAGERFAVQLMLPSRFDWMGCFLVSATARVDGGSIRACPTGFSDIAELDGNTTPLTSDIDTTTMRIDGTDYLCGLSFAEAEMCMSFPHITPTRTNG